MLIYQGVWRARIDSYDWPVHKYTLVRAGTLAVVLELSPLPSGTRSWLLLWLDGTFRLSFWSGSALLTHAEPVHIISYN